MGKTIFYQILILILLLCHLTAFSETVTNIPLSDENVSILRRFEAKGYFDESLGYCLPLSRSQAVDAIETIIVKEEHGKIRLTKIEQQFLQQLKSDFYYELKERDVELDGITPERHIFRWQKNQNEANFDVIGSLNFDYQSGDNYPDDEKIFQTTLGGVLRGSLWHGNLGFYARSTETREDGTRSYSESDEPDDEGYIEYYGSYAYFDRTDAYIIFSIPWVDSPNRFAMEMGKYPIAWGPGYRGKLVLSDNPESFNIIKFQGKYSRLRFVSFMGFLKSDILDTLRTYHTATGKQRKVYRTKFMAGHRFEFNVMRGIRLAVEEIAVYGDRDLDIGYLNPIMFYRSYEHNYDDLDNMGIGADFSIRLIPKTEIYGELFVDDIYLAKLNTAWWGNKLGYLGGIYTVEPFSISNLDLRFEYAQLEPWVYSHFYPINTYTHDSEVIGHWMGPNAANFYLEGNYLFSNRLDVRLYSELTCYGKDEDGGDIFMIHQDDMHGDDSHFLAGVVEENFSIGGQVRYEAIPDFAEMRLAAKWMDQKNTNNVEGDSKSNFELNLVLDFDW